MDDFKKKCKSCKRFAIRTDQQGAELGFCGVIFIGKLKQCPDYYISL